MDQWISTARGALLLDGSAFERFHDRHDVFLRGVLLVVVVALISTAPAFILDLARGLRGQDLLNATNIQAEFEQGLQQALPYFPTLPPSVLQQIRQGFEMGSEIAARIEAVPTPLPRPIGRGLEAFGHWLSQPFGASFPLAAATLGTWLGYGIWVLLFARLLGGRGDMAGFFGATALFAVPHLLGVFRPVPYIGTIVWLVAAIWGLVIYVKATAVSQGLTYARALVAVLLPVIVAALVLLILGIGLVGLLATLVGGGS